MLLKLTAIIDGEFVPYYTEDVSVIAYYWLFTITRIKEAVYRFRMDLKRKS